MRNFNTRAALVRGGLVSSCRAGSGVAGAGVPESLRCPCGAGVRAVPSACWVGALAGSAVGQAGVCAVGPVAGAWVLPVRGGPVGASESQAISANIISINHEWVVDIEGPLRLQYEQVLKPLFHVGQQGALTAHMVILQQNRTPSTRGSAAADVSSQNVFR